jgi:DNA-binding NarL/FixJ family response regulator
VLDSRPLSGEQQHPIRMLLADDHDLFRTGLASLLSAEPDIDVIAQASGGKMAVRLARELRPNVVLMDLRMPDLSGADAARVIVDENPDIRVVMLTVAVEQDDIASAILAGACGYVLKDVSTAEVLAAVRAAIRGEPWLSARAAATLLDLARRQHVAVPPEPPELVPLSKRELDVLRLLARGLDNNEIAAELFISVRTAKTHVSSILMKLGVSNRIQAAVYAVHRGFV